LLDELDNDRDHEASEQAEMSASRAKILLQEIVEAEEIDEEKWTKLKGRSIVSSERLQGRLGDAVSCRFCQGDVNIMEISKISNANIVKQKIISRLLTLEF